MELSTSIGGRYEVESQLGEGGMGQVYRVRHRELGKAFALKIISPAFASNHMARSRFNREAKIASEISHPNIVSVVDYGEDPQLGVYMVMELVEGEPLITPGVLPMSVKHSIDVLAQVADALEHIHKRGIIHGDIKADNLVLSEEPASERGSRRRRVVRLLDFGLASRHGHHDEDGVSGTPHYLAPERAEGAPASIASDIYALGVLGYLLLTATLPFDGSAMEVLMAQINATPDPISTRRRDPIDPAVEKLLARAMAKDPADRHPSAAAFRYELNTVMDMLGLGRRRSRPQATTVVSEHPHTSAITRAFEQSKLPQAIVSFDGNVITCNDAFRKFVKDDCDDVSLPDTRLAQLVPGVMHAFRTAHIDGTPVEHHAEVSRGPDRSTLEITIWVVPLPTEIHMLIRVAEKELI